MVHVREEVVVKESRTHLQGIRHAGVVAIIVKSHPLLRSQHGRKIAKDIQSTNTQPPQPSSKR